MKKLTLSSVGSLEQYQRQRPAIRRAMIEHKKNRRILLGPNATLHFEDYMTMKYQVQEMMRAEGLRDESEIQAELDAYNPLIPDGCNLKCTFMLEFPDETQRRVELSRLLHLERHIHIRIAGFRPVAPIADEDLERCTGDKTSAVHFMRYELSPEMIAAAREGAPWAVFSDHPAYTHQVDPLPETVIQALTRDFA